MRLLVCVASSVVWQTVIQVRCNSSKYWPSSLNHANTQRRPHFLKVESVGFPQKSLVNKKSCLLITYGQSLNWLAMSERLWGRMLFYICMLVQSLLRTLWLILVSPLQRLNLRNPLSLLKMIIKRIQCKLSAEVSVNGRATRYRNVFACLLIKLWIVEVKRSRCVFHPLLGLHTHTSANKTEENAFASSEKFKGTLGKISAEEETLRKGTPTVNFLQQYILPSWPTLKMQHAAGRAAIRSPIVCCWTWTIQTYNDNLQSAVGLHCKSPISVCIPLDQAIPSVLSLPITGYGLSRLKKPLL